MEDFKLQPARDHGLGLKESFCSLRREDGLAAAASHLLWWTLVRSYLTVVHRLRVDGLQNLPIQTPFIMVANHTSHLDTLVLASSLPLKLRARALPVAAGDTFFSSTGKSAFAALALNALPLRRKSGAMHAMQELRNRVTQGDCVMIIFPEGTRSRSGLIAEFKAGLGMIVAGTNVPVVPCRLFGCYEALSADSKMPRLKPLRLSVGEPLHFTETPNQRDGWKSVAEKTQAAVEALS